MNYDEGGGYYAASPHYDWSQVQYSDFSKVNYFTQEDSEADDNGESQSLLKA
jgi:hypothetical protein